MTHCYEIPRFEQLNTINFSIPFCPSYHDKTNTMTHCYKIPRSILLNNNEAISLDSGIYICWKTSQVSSWNKWENHEAISLEYKVIALNLSIVKKANQTVNSYLSILTWFRYIIIKIMKIMYYRKLGEHEFPVQRGLGFVSHLLFFHQFASATLEI